ncbi:MAG: hypothetical protein ACR2LS_02960 [Thermomicrobiales bacterium]
MAAIVTEYRENAHADVIVGKLLEGFELHGERVEPRIEIASLYLDQVPANDMGRDMAARHGVPLFATIGEAMTLGKTGINVDGVLLIGEHGDYPWNARDQHLYPRRRFFDASVAAMVAGGRTVPAFIDKHLSWSFANAKHIADTAERLQIPLLAGSSIPIAWREPAVQWPLGQDMDEAVAIGYEPLEAYGFHALEGLQGMVERRAGGETGVQSVQYLSGESIWQAEKEGRFASPLVDATLMTLLQDKSSLSRARAVIDDVFLIEYRDGLRATVLMCNEMISDWACAATGGGEQLAYRNALQPGKPFGHFGFLVRQIESLVLNNASPYPVARTLLTTGILDAVMRSRHEGNALLQTPELDIQYTAVEDVPDTGIGVPRPFDLRMF